MPPEKKFAILRIAFGFVWAIDAWFKWQPGFLNGLPAMLTSMLPGEPAWVQIWIRFWITIVNINPHLFAILIALLETAIALSLILGLYTRLMLWISIFLALLVWSVGEAFGGPYGSGSTDIGAAVIYAFAAAGLLIGMSWKEYSLDSSLARRNNQ